MSDTDFSITYVLVKDTYEAVSLQSLVYSVCTYVADVRKANDSKPATTLNTPDIQAHASNCHKSETLFS